MGSKIIEKHFTNKKQNRKFRDHQVSTTKSDLKNMAKLNTIRKIQGNFEKKYQR